MFAHCLPLLLALGKPCYTPQVTAITPCGGQRGTEVVATFTGQRLFDPQGLLLVRPGLVVLAVQGDKPESCRVTLRIPPDCPLGAHPLRLRTSYGISNLVTFEVGVLAELAADQKGGEPQQIPVNCTVNGRLGAEETHRYALEVPEGARVCCEVEASRLGFAPNDVVLAALAPDGGTVATSDDTALGMKDPLLTFVAASAGRYVVQVSAAFGDAVNAGPYRLHAGTFPRPTGALPCGGQAGEELELELLGDVPGSRARVRLPEDARDVFRFFPADDRGTAPTPILLRVGGPPNQVPVPDAQGRLWVEFPASVHGVVGKPEASLRYWFRAKKGQEIEFTTFARALRSPLDPVVTTRSGDGRFLASNDDGRGLDSVVRFSAPADGEFTVDVRDLLRRGSPEHFFRLEGATRSSPMSLRMIVNQREEAVLPVPRGGRGAVVLQISNADYDAGLSLLAEHLPDGVTASFGPVVRGLNLVPLVLAATEQAPLAGASVGFAARAEKAPASRPAGYAQEVPLVYVRNNQPILSTTLHELSIAVTEPAPFSIELEPPKVPIVRGAPLGLRVRVVRSQGFAEPVRVRALWNPPGVSAGQLVLDGKQDAGTLPIDANANATLGTFPYAVIGAAAQRGGSLELSSSYVDLQIEKPWVTAELGKCRTEQGKPAELRVKLKPQRELGAAYRASLLGLPRGVTAAAQEVAPTAESVGFALTVAADAQIGRHGNFLVELLVPVAGDTVVHRFGGGEIRVDGPLANKADRPPGNKPGGSKPEGNK